MPPPVRGIEASARTNAYLAAGLGLMFAFFGEDPFGPQLEAAIHNKTVTYDFARLMEGARKVKCSEFGDEIIKQLG